MLRCCICDVTIQKKYFCLKCYNKYKNDILSGEPWVKFLKSDERRKRNKREPLTVYLGDTYDISDSYKLIYRS